jgi:hypothetical protein
MRFHNISILLCAPSRKENQRNPASQPDRRLVTTGLVTPFDVTVDQFDKFPRDVLAAQLDRLLAVTAA